MLNLKTGKKGQRGDTIIEVLFAITIFSLVAVGALSVMNQGVSSVQRSLEITLVRQQIDAQGDLLRFIHDSYVRQYIPGRTDYANGTPEGLWRDISASKTVDSALSFDQMVTANNLCVSPNSVPKSFAINAQDGKATYVRTLSDATNAYSRVYFGAPGSQGDPSIPNSVVGTAYGLWVQAVKTQDRSNRGVAIDFHIRACWYSPGSTVPSTLGTIVRLYDPTN